MRIISLFSNTAMKYSDYTQIKKHAASFKYNLDADGTLYIYFEASNGIIDWLNNFDFAVKPYKDMENKWLVHRGFLRVWKVARDYLENVIKNTSVKKIAISGYSHGAALALLCYEYCRFNREDIYDYIYGYGFGSPRVIFGKVNQTIKDRFNNFYIFRNCKDLITHLPPKVFGFKHLGTVIHIGKDEKLGCIKSHYADKYRKSLAEEGLGFYDVCAHLPC